MRGRLSVLVLALIIVCGALSLGGPILPEGSYQTGCPVAVDKLGDNEISKEGPVRLAKNVTIRDIAAKDYGPGPREYLEIFSLLDCIVGLATAPALLVGQEGEAAPSVGAPYRYLGEIWVCSLRVVKEGLNNTVVSGRLSSIDDFNVKSGPFVELDPLRFYVGNIYIGAQLPLGCVFGDFVCAKSRIRSPARFSEGYKNEAQAEYAESHSDNRRYPNSPGPSSHHALGFKAAFLALTFVGGLAFCRYAALATCFRKRETFAFYGYVAGICIGVCAFGGLLFYYEL